MPRPVARIGSLLLSDPRPCHVREIRNARCLPLQRARQFDHTLLKHRQVRRVEGMATRYLLTRDLSLFQPSLYPRHCLYRSSQHAAARTHRHGYALSHCHCQHRSGWLLADPARPQRNQPQSIFQREHTREAGRHIFTHAVTQHGLRTNAPAHQQPSQCITDHKERWLSQFGPSQRSYCPLTMARKAVVLGSLQVLCKEQRAQIQPQVGLQQLATVIQLLLEDPLTLVQLLRHAHVLLAHSWKHKHNWTLRALLLPSHE